MLRLFHGSNVEVKNPKIRPNLRALDFGAGFYLSSSESQAVRWAKMSKQSDFFIYLIERYAEAKKTTATNILQQWDSLDLTNFIYDMYDLYHTERLKNAFDDIDKLILEKIG